MKHRIRLTETQLHNIIRESVERILNEDAPSRGIKSGDIFTKIFDLGEKGTIDKIAKRYGVDPKDFVINGRDIVYSPKKKRGRKASTETLSKPKGMGTDEYFDKMVAPTMIAKGKEEFANIDGEVWLPLPNKGRYFKGELDPSEVVEVSNMGRVRIINCANGLKSKIDCGYYAPTRGAVQVHINSTDSAGKPLKTTGFLVNMVFDAFCDPEGEIDPSEVRVIYLDGNPRNCRLDNLDFKIVKKGGEKNG